MSNNNPIKSALDKSCEQITPEIEQKLNARRNLAIKQRHSRRFSLGYALAPVALISLLWFNMPQEQLSVEEQALYEDIQLLILEDDLEFLDDMSVQDWLPELNTNGDEA